MKNKWFPKNPSTLGYMNVLESQYLLHYLLATLAIINYLLLTITIYPVYIGRMLIGL